MKGQGEVARRLLAGGAALACAVVAAEASAAPPTAAAESLFERARRLAESGQLEAACPLFAESNRLDPGVGVLLYLAACQEGTGRIATAWATFREARDAAEAQGQADRVAIAQERITALEPRVPRLRVVVPPEAESQGWIVRRDDLVLGPSLWDGEIPVDPGERRIEVLAPGFKPFATTVLIPEGAVTRVELPRLVPDTEPYLVSSTAARNADEGDGGWKPIHTTAVALGGVGVVGLALGTGFGIAAASQWSEADDHCRSDTTPWRCDSQGLDAADATDTSAAISTTAFVIGGSALATGLVLWLVSPELAEQTARVGVAGGPGDAGISLTRAF